MTEETKMRGEVAAWVPCPLCQAPIQPVISELFSAYFAKVPVTCSPCGGSIDWWDALVRAANEHFMLTGAFHLLGCRTTVLGATLERERAVVVDLVAEGVAPSAEILNINCTAGGDIRPLLMHSNVAWPAQESKTLSLYGASFGRPGPDTGSVTISVTWIDVPEEQVAFRALVSASRAFDLGRYDSLVVPANVAVEHSVGLAIAAWLGGFTGKKRVEEFLSNAATYSHQLNVLLPIACHAVGVPTMPDALRGHLNKLRDHRNNVAHRGATKGAVSKETAAELLTAAVFGYHFARLLHGEVARGALNGRLPPAAGA